MLFGAAGTTRVELELRPGAQVRGTVLGGGAPLSDARVTLVDAAGTVLATTRTGPNGTYAFCDLDTGAYTVVATGYATADGVGDRVGPRARAWTSATSNSPTPTTERTSE
ncbi:carboxypeptidase-like regulatory domain-containing protein [Streptomyces sp. bgisy032]|uniref:carboxypeptidase-like regulatory domain-containing protein n=1 Tax=Streptomyces sp. bgisy032 TaxID=3413773 RepID=UPI003D72B4DA